MRKHKGMTEAEAAAAMADPLFFGAMLVRQGMADGMVAGAVNATGNVLRAGFQIVGTAPGAQHRLQLLRHGQARLGPSARTACWSSATAP